MTMQKAISRHAKVVPQPISISLEERARAAFYSQYVSGFSSTYDVLDQLYGLSPADVHLPASVDAVSLAFFSFQYGAGQAFPGAQVKYAYALSLLSKALAAPETAKSDSTLLAVLLLDLYEKITNCGPRSTESWMSHVQGALALVKLRDNTQFTDQVGVRLSLRLCFTLGISCIAAKAPIPPELVELRAAIEPHVNRGDQKWLMSGLCLEYTILSSNVVNNLLSDSEIIRQATMIDHQFKILAQIAPPDWLPTTTYLETKSERVLEDHFDVHPDHFVAQVSNVICLMRILLNDIIRTHTKLPDEQRKSDLATNIIDSMAKQICASVPQYTGHESVRAKTKAFTEGQRLQCYTLFFPVYTAALHVSAKSKIKPWIIEQLWFMSNELRVRNASVVAGLIESDDPIDPWSTYSPLWSLHLSSFSPRRC